MNFPSFSRVLACMCNNRNQDRAAGRRNSWTTWFANKRKKEKRKKIRPFFLFFTFQLISPFLPFFLLSSFFLLPLFSRAPLPSAREPDTWLWPPSSTDRPPQQPTRAAFSPLLGARGHQSSPFPPSLNLLLLRSLASSLLALLTVLQSVGLP